MKDKVRLVVDVDQRLAAAVRREAEERRVSGAAILRWALIDRYAGQIAAERLQAEQQAQAEA